MNTLEVAIHQGPAAGSTIPLDGRSVTIGRGSANHVVLKDEKVSTHHARIDVTPGGLILTDLGSKNGTFVGGEVVIGSRMIQPGTEVTLGSTTLEVRYSLMSNVQVHPSSTGEPPRKSPSESLHISQSVAADALRRAVQAQSRRDARVADEAALAAGPVSQPAAPALAGVSANPAQRRASSDAGRDLILQPALHPAQRNLTKAQRNLAVLAEVGEMIATERDADRFLNRLMDLIFDVLPADRGCLILVEEGNRPVPRVSRISERASAEEIHVSRTVLTKVLGGVSILTADAGADARLAQGASIIAQNVRSVMCVPIRGRRRSIGAIYVDTVLTVGVFGKDDLEMLSTVGVLAGTALENIQLFRENVQHERMAAIGKVVAGLGHDIRNMLTALRGGMYLVDEFLRESQDEHLCSAWRVVQHGHESIVSLVQDMVSYSKPRDPDWRLSDLNQVVESACEFVKTRADEKGIAVTRLLDPTVQHFWFDGSAIERCVLNLLTNAVDAAPHGTGQVSVQIRVDDERQVAVLTVQDNGEGIPAENREKVFDLLFSTKGSRGTGFGLAITKKLVQEHSGRVWFNSDLGKGTAFHIELPLRAARPTAVLV